jgi:hypothetical protein
VLERVIVTEPLDGANIGALGLGGRDKTSHNRLSIQEDRARTTFPFAAPFFRAREPAILA